MTDDRQPQTQPPPPPPESDPNREYSTAEIPLERPQSNDANRPGEDLRGGEVPDDAAAHGVRPDALDSA